jgi:UDP-N-acetylmuramoyl-L-alanyl-D-glutamate--2,6-diaminopimelate ligase
MRTTENTMPETDATASTSAHGGETRRATLGSLLASAGVPLKEPVAGIVVTSVEYDSRRVVPGSLFVAVRGFVTDGHKYVGDAADQGAVAALVEEPTGTCGLPEIVVDDTRIAMGLVAHEFYGRPSEEMKTHGITGTNGKTTTSYLVDSIMREAGIATGVVGTLGYRLGDVRRQGDRTSPESLDLARLLADMVDEGVETVTMEVSSHALALGRAVGTKFDTATLTNLSRDHLDFHGTFEEYAAAKRVLFERLAGDAWKLGAVAIVNRDDPFGRQLAAWLGGPSGAASGGAARVRLLTYGMAEGDLHARDVVTTPSGTTARFVTPAGEFDAKLELISEFNVMNALAATAIAVSQGVPLETIRAGLARVSRVEGRLELVDGGQGFAIVVDYAHTPDALEKVLDALRSLHPERLITVFGCGGDRDRGKRPMMGEIAVGRSDFVIVTSDNPRKEDPDAIIRDILDGAEEATGRPGVELEVIEERRDAIRRAVEIARDGDIVLIAGKGHEDYQILGDVKIHFDDREEARAALERARAGRRSNGEGKAH